MASLEHLEILESGRDNWNSWMKKNWRESPQIEVRADKVLRRSKGIYVPFLKADLSGTDLTKFKALQGYDFHKVDFSNCNLRGIDFRLSNFQKAWLKNADIRNANFNNCHCEEAVFINSNLDNSSFTNAILLKTNFGKASLYKTNFNGADLTNAIFMMAGIIGTKFNGSNLTNCRVYGASIWDIELEHADQSGIIISKRDAITITVDNLEIAQFLYLIVSNKKFKEVIETLTSKIVLILGRFTENRKQILDRVKAELAKLNLVPVIFDFQKPSNKDYLEPVVLIAQLARFVIADFSDAKLILEEISMIARNTSAVILPIIEKTQEVPLTLKNLYNSRSISETFYYHNEEHLIKNLVNPILQNGEKVLAELNGRKPQ